MKSALWLLYWKATFLGFLLKRSWGMTWMDRIPLWGDPLGVAGHMRAPSMEPLLFLGFTSMPLWKDFIHVLFGFYCKTTLPLGFPINRRCVGCHKLILAFTYTCHLMLSGSLSPSHEKSFRRAERLSVFRWELVLDGEALPDR